MPGLRNLPVWRYLPTLLILAGALLIAYTAFQYATMYLTQRQLARQWEQQNQQTVPPRESATIPGEDSAAGEDSSAGQNARKEPGMIRLEVPAISLDAIVVEGTTNKALSLGPGRMLRTAIPGEKGNAVITAHRDTFFRHIHELEKGQEIRVHRDGQTYRFEVTGKKVVEPTDVYVLDPTPDSQLTLITCYPTYYIGPAPQRLVVFSKLAQPSGVRPNAAVSSHQTPAAGQ